MMGRGRNASRRLYAAILCLLWLGAAARVGAAEPPPLKRVLLLHQELTSRPFRARFNAIFIDALRATGGDAYDIYEEAIESDRFSGAEQMRLVTDYLRNKYAGRKIDVIVVVGGNALTFASTHREMFGNPAIVAAVFRDGLIADAGTDEITGLQGGKWMTGTIDLSVHLRPDTQRIFVVNGTRNGGRDVEAEIARELQARRSAVELISLKDLPLSELTLRVAAIPEHSVVFYVRQTIRNQSQDLDPFEALAQVLRASPVPVFVQQEEFMGRGVLGGYMWRFEPDARRLADITRRLVTGVRPRDIPVGEASYDTLIDSRQLQRWNIPQDRVPAGAIVMFREPSFFEQYRGYVIAGALAFGFQFALITWLFVERVRRHRAEADARSHTERYRSVVDSQSDLICRFLPDTTLTFVNDAYCRFWNRGRDELIGRKFIELVPPASRPAVLERIGNLLSGMDSHEHPVTLPDGTIGWHHWINRAVLDKEGRLVEIQGVGRDITDRKRAEDAIGQLETRNSAMLRAIPDLMFVLLRDGTYVDFHARDSRMLFAAPNTFIGKKVRDVLPPSLADLFEDALRRALATDETIVVEYELSMDVPRHFEARLVHAGTDRVLSIVRDVTDSKRATELNRQLAGRLIVSQEAERQRIARELHDDVSQKIALLMLNLESLASRSGIEREKFRDVSDRVNEIASDLHQLSHELHPSKLHALGLVAAVESLCRDCSRAHDIQVAFSHTGVPPTIDQEISLCLYRIVQEALHNVARHSQARRARVRLTRDNDALVLRIADSGVGFDPQVMTHAGLGLVSMRERATVLSGQLTIDAYPGGGTRVDVRIPLTQPATDAAPVSQTA
jgi:PAS domain S-box-containing protein